MVRRLEPSAARRFKNTLYGHVARIGKAFSSPCRLELLDLLAQGPRTVDALAREAGQTLANTSQHLRVLRAARLVDADKRGVFVACRLADDQVAALFLALRELADSRLAEIERTKRAFLEERGALEPVDRQALIARVRAGRATVLDVRPRDEYRAGHIRGALSIPLAELRRRLAELPRNRDIVAYCRGPYCVMAVEAVRILRGHGLRAARLEDGVLEWRARGFDVAVGNSRPSSRRRPTARELEESVT